MGGLLLRRGGCRWCCSACRSWWRPPSWWICCSSVPSLQSPSFPAGMAPKPLAQGLLTLWEHGELEQQLALLCWLPCQAQASCSCSKRCPGALVSSGVGPSPVMETRFSPGSSARPKSHFSSHSGCFTIFGLVFLNSSQRIKFMFLLKALKVPLKMRSSCRIHLILWLLPSPTVMVAVQIQCLQ